MVVLAGILREHKGSKIVFRTGRQDVVETAERLNAAGELCGIYHGTDPKCSVAERKEQDEKNAAALKLWMRTKTTMVATVAFAMGIDKADVEVVVHYDTPSSMESAVQQSGRVGRDGSDAHHYIFTGLQDSMSWRGMFGDNQTDTGLQRSLQRVDEVERWVCSQVGCRTASLYRPFDGDDESKCDLCDLCASQTGEDAEARGGVDCTSDARDMASVISLSGAALGRKKLVQYIRGSGAGNLSEWISRFRPEVAAGTCPLFGKGEVRAPEYWFDILNQIFVQGITVWREMVVYGRRVFVMDLTEKGLRLRDGLDDEKVLMFPGRIQRISAESDNSADAIPGTTHGSTIWGGVRHVAQLLVHVVRSTVNHH